MRTVSEINKALFEWAPDYMKESWDNVGLLCGHSERAVDTVLVALDPYMDVAQEAQALGAQLIVTHHPLLFHPAKSVNDSNAIGRTLLFLIENGIAAINLHTNLDSAPGGVNDRLAALLGLKEVQVLLPAGQDAEGRDYGPGRYGSVTQTDLQSFLQLIKERLSCDGLRYADAGKAVSKVAVGGGSCGDFLERVAELECDTFVTADLRYNQFIDALDVGVNIIDAGHFPTENPICGDIAAKLTEQFPELRVYISKKHVDPVLFAD